MKISITSMQRVCNFGSVLQAYSLRKLLNELGHEVSFVDFAPQEDDPVMKDEYRVIHTSDLDGWSSSTFKRYVNKINRYAFNRGINRYRQYKQEKRLREFQYKILGVCDEVNEQQFDICVIGSDEVFNCLQGRYSHFLSQLFGNVQNAKKVITYAASCGFTTYDLMPAEFIKKAEKSFKCISAFSVRDNNTMDFVKRLSKRDDIYEHLDPVLIGNFDNEISKCNKEQHLPYKYCVVYSYANRIHDENEINAIKEFCRKKNLRIISLGFQQTWIRDFVVTDPFELLYLISNADFVITDTFHGTIFSAKYANRFAVLIRESNNNKLNDLIEKLRAREHVLSDVDNMEKVYSVENDREKVKKICKIERDRAIEYFNNNL